jgi:Lectin C-type domain
MKRAIALAAVSIGITCHSAAAEAVATQPIQWEVAAGGNGHWYAFVSDPGVTWTAAEAAAEASGGYLATITSAAENDFVGAIWQAHLGPSAWIGGYQTPPTTEVDFAANWHWITGEPWGYTNWHAGEPNNYTGIQEDKLQFSYFSNLWNDSADVANYGGNSMAGYLVEWNSDVAPLVSTMTYPANGAIGADLSSPIQWTSTAYVQAYYLYVGTSVGAKDLVNTGEIHQTSYLAVGLPAGQTLYARIWTKIGGIWQYRDSTFSAAASIPVTATITYPTNGAVNADLSQPIQWTSVPNVQAYYLYVGTTAGAKDLVNTGELQQTMYPAPYLPVGQTVYARIWTKVGGGWRYRDGAFSVAPGNTPLHTSSTITRSTTNPVIVTVNSVDDNATVTVNGTIRLTKGFSNTPQSVDITPYLVQGANTILFEVSNTSQGWSYDWQMTADGTAVIKDRCAVWNTYPACLNDDQTVGLVYRYTVTLNSPSDIAPLVSMLTYPGNGAVNADPSQPIQWTSVANAQAYYLCVGTTVGSKDLVNTGEIQQTSYLASGLPAGQTLYARIWTKINGVWRYTDSTFSAAASTPLTATITYPTNGAVNADLSQPIQWTSVANAQAYYLYVGTTAGSKDLVDTHELQQTCDMASNLPVGQTVYARIWTKVAGIWRYRDSTFSVAPDDLRLQKSSTVSRTTADPVVVTVNSVDDNATVTVNGTIRLTKGFSNTPQSVDITPYLVSGTNTILFEVSNTGQGWSYNWQMSADGTAVITDTCATWNAYPGCLNDDQTVGLVYRHTVTLISTAQQ